MTSVSLMIGLPLPADAITCLQNNGFLLPPPLVEARRPRAAGNLAFLPLSPIQGQICAALTRQPLNDRQKEVLAIYWRADRGHEPALSIEEVGRRLAASLELDPARAADYVRGALRSFGRRLFRTAAKPGEGEHAGEANGEAIPLLSLIAIETGPTGEARHRLTDDGAIAVAAALGLNASGETPAILPGDPDAIVAVGMSRSAAAALLRAQEVLGLGLDAAVKALATQAGAG